LGLAEILGFVLGVEVEKQDAVIGGDPVVNDPCAASLPMALGSPAEFAAATGIGNNISGVGLLHQKHLDREDPIVTDQAECIFGEFRIFLKGLGILRMISQPSRYHTKYDFQRRAGATHALALPSSIAVTFSATAAGRMAKYFFAAALVTSWR
jgi:hypothetical protein